MRSLLATLLLILGSWLWSVPAPAGGGLDFVVIQPGHPGSPAEAQPVMDALASYLTPKVSPGKPMQGRYFNDLDQALEYLQRERPAWGIVSLGFFVQYAKEFDLAPLGATRPGGWAKDVWQLVVNKTAPDDLRSLRGKVQGTMLFTKDFAACLLFGQTSLDSPISLTGTFQPLRALREVTQEKTAGVVLDRLQYQALSTLPLIDSLKVVYATGELPTSPVVCFENGKAPGSELLQEALGGMREDPEAQNLLNLLQTDGFGPPDPSLPELRIETHERCPP